jgi:hypothetical protein
MVKEEWRQEFVKAGEEIVRENVQQGAYPPDKNLAAIRWLRRRDPARKSWKAAKDIRELARRTARQTRITLMLVAVAVGLLVVGIFLLWRIEAYLNRF